MAPIIIDALDKSFFPGLKENPEFTLCATPITIERETGNIQGAITGSAFTNDRMQSEARFMKIDNSANSSISDILQCGQWTFSPSGLPVSILTGKLVADKIKKELGNNKKLINPIV